MTPIKHFHTSELDEVEPAVLISIPHFELISYLKKNISQTLLPLFELSDLFEKLPYWKLLEHVITPFLKKVWVGVKIYHLLFLSCSYEKYSAEMDSQIVTYFSDQIPN